MLPRRFRDLARREVQVEEEFDEVFCKLYVEFFEFEFIERLGEFKSGFV